MIDALQYSQPKLTTPSSLSYIVALVLTGALGAFNVGFSFTVYNASMLQVESSMGWTLSELPLKRGLTSCVIPGGAIFGAFLAGLLADYIGRRKTLMFTDLVMIIGSIMSLSTEFHIFIIGRILCGVGCGFNYGIIPLYIREMSPPDISGKTGGAFKTLYCIGLIGSFSAAFALPLMPEPSNNIWRFMFAIPAIISLIRLVLFAIFLQFDTPKYYILKDDEINAKKILNKIYGFITDSIYDQEKRADKSTKFEVLWSSKYKKQLQLCLLLYFCLAFYGGYTLSFYSSLLFLGSEDTTTPDLSFEVRVLNLCVSLIRLAGAIGGAFLADRYGRRAVLLNGCIAVIISVNLFALMGFLGLSFPGRISLLFYAASLAASFSPLLPIYSSELLPAKGITTCVAFENFLGLFITFIFPLIIGKDNNNSMEFVFIFFGFVAIITYPLLRDRLRETRRLSMHEIFLSFHLPEQAQQEISRVVRSYSHNDKVSELSTMML